MATWIFDPAHSSVSFAIRHIMVSWVRGHVERYPTRLEARNREKYLKSSGRKTRLKSQYAQVAELVDALA